MGSSDINNDDLGNNVLVEKVVPLFEDVILYINAALSQESSMEGYMQRIADSIRRYALPISVLNLNEAGKQKDAEKSLFSATEVKNRLLEFLREVTLYTEKLNQNENKKIFEAIWELRRAINNVGYVVDENIPADLDAFMVDNFKTLSPREVDMLKEDIIKQDLYRLNVKLRNTIDDMIPCFSGASGNYSIIFFNKMEDLGNFVGQINLKKHTEKDLTLTYSEDKVNEAKETLSKNLTDCLLLIKNMQKNVDPGKLDFLLVAVHQLVIFIEKKHPDLNILKIYDHIKDMDAPTFKKEIVKIKTERSKRIILESLEKIEKLSQINSAKLTYEQVGKIAHNLNENLLDDNIDRPKIQPIYNALLSKLNEINSTLDKKLDLLQLNKLVDDATSKKIEDLLANRMISGLDASHDKTTQGSSKKESKLSENEAATRIQTLWRSAKLSRELGNDPVTTYRGILSATNTTASLPHRMFGQTVAHIKDKKTPFYDHRDASHWGSSSYHRSDNFDVRASFPEYGLSDDPQDNYFPFSQLKSFPIEMLRAYMGELADETEVIKSNNNDVAFFKYPPLDEYQTSSMRTLLTSLGFKSSPWALAKASTNDASITPDSVASSPTMQKLMSTMPTNLEGLLNSKDYGRLIQLTKDRSSACQILGTALLKLISGMTEINDIPPENIQRIALFLKLAMTFYQQNYVRFSVMTNAIIHEISLILNENLKANHPTIRLEDMRAEAVTNFFKYLDLPTQSEDDNYSFDVFPCTSGTNAFAIALSLATNGMKFDESAIKTIGPLYYELKTIFQNEFFGNDVYVFTLGPMLTDNVHYLNNDINQMIRVNILPDHPPDKPLTLVVDLTTSLYENVHLDEDIQELVKSGRLSIVFFESHQKFGLLHSDQAQYGRVISLTSKTNFPQENLQKMRENAQVDLNSHLDMQIGAYINNACGTYLEEIKHRHYDNSTLLARVLETQSELADRLVKQENNSDSCFVAMKNEAELLDLELFENLESFFMKRDSFGHTYTTLASVQQLYRISAGATDSLDTYLQAQAFLTTYNFDKNILLMTIKSLLKEYADKKMLPSHEMLLAVCLQGLMKYDVKNSFSDLYVAHMAIKFLIVKSDSLKGREIIQSLGDHVSELHHALFNSASLDDGKQKALLQIVTSHLSSKPSQIEATVSILSALDILKRIDYPAELPNQLLSESNASQSANFYKSILALDFICSKKDQVLKEFCHLYCHNPSIANVLQTLGDLGSLNENTIRKAIDIYNNHRNISGNALVNLITVTLSNETGKKLFSEISPSMSYQMSKVAEMLGDDFSLMVGRETKHLVSRLQSLSRHISTQSVGSSTQEEMQIFTFKAR